MGQSIQEGDQSNSRSGRRYTHHPPIFECFYPTTKKMHCALCLLQQNLYCQKLICACFSVFQVYYTHTGLRCHIYIYIYVQISCIFVKERDQLTAKQVVLCIDGDESLERGQEIQFSGDKNAKKILCMGTNHYVKYAYFFRLKINWALLILFC